jgi:hypothetical protein
MRWSPGSDGSVYPSSAGGPTIDQYIASLWNGQTQYGSLEFGINTATSMGNTFLWRGVNEPVPCENEPQAMFDRLFFDLATISPEEQERIGLRRASVLQAVKANIDHVQTKVSREDLNKLNSHLDSIESLEQSLQGAQLGGSCAIPTLDTSQGNELYEAMAHVDMMTMALACDMTRVASLCMDEPNWSWLDVDFDSGWHDAVHSGPASIQLESDLIEAYQFFPQILAYLIQSLKAIPEGEGTLLDNTLILFTNEFSTGQGHSHEGKLYLLAGGAGGAIRTDRYLALKEEPHGNVFTAILNALDIEDTSFGDPDFCTGATAGVVG